MPRLFTGIEIPSDIAFELELKQGGVPGARWITRDLLHMTLRFIGDVSDQMASELADALSEISASAFQLCLAGIGAFGGRKPRALYAGVNACAELIELQASQERLCQRFGLAPAARNYHPHVTLARLKSTTVSPVQNYIGAHNLYRSRAFDVPRFVLYSAKPLVGGGPYLVEQAYDLDDMM